MRLLIEGGTVVQPSGLSRGDVLVDDGRIAAVGPDLEPDADETIDATGLHIFPGFIDPHVHTRDPGQTHKEDIGHVTRAAAAGGTTTILEMPNAVPPLTTASIFRERALDHGKHAHVDFGLWGLVLGRESSEHLRELRDAGVVAVKLFWGYDFDKETQSLVYSATRSAGRLINAASNGDVWQLLVAAAKVNLLVGVHCEDREVLAAAAALNGDVRTYRDLLTARPAAAESVSVAALVELARAARARTHVLHVSTAQSAQLVRRAQLDGVPVTAESCPHYLTLTAEDFERTASALKVFPPVRDESNRSELWESLVDGVIGSVGSDHAPHSPEERSGAFAAQPAGVTGVETMGRVMLDQAHRGRISLPQLAWTLAEQTARIYGLYPRKGGLVPGADADITLVDMRRQWTIDNSRLHSKHPASPWDGRSGYGTPVLTLLRGETVMRDGEPVGGPTGQLVRPGPDH